MKPVTKAILIDMIHPSLSKEDSLMRLEELEDLVETYGGLVIVKRYQKRQAPHPKTYIGTGKVTELGEEGKELGASIVIVNAALKPRQLYVIGEMLRPYKIQVWDRIDLILKIFAKHASTTEAKLEIELASIRHMGPRIFGMGMELSRQGGGIGTSGIGETNTEIMRRHLRVREGRIKKKLEEYARVRSGHQKDRLRRHLKTVALVGYTNAGKTTLLNTLTGRHEYVADKLFATLDTRVGELYLPSRSRSVLVSDTIGFIQDLPPELLNAFASTLSEARGADVLLHVFDVADPRAKEKEEVVNRILTRLGMGEIPKILVGNKNDRLSKQEQKRWMRERPDVCQTSAIDGFGIPELLEHIGEQTYTTEHKNPSS